MFLRAEADEVIVSFTDLLRQGENKLLGRPAGDFDTCSSGPAHVKENMTELAWLRV